MRHLQVSFCLSSSHSILWVCVTSQVFTCIWKGGVSSHLWKFNGNVWPLSVKVGKFFSGGGWNSPEPSLCRSLGRERNASLFLISENMSSAIPEVWHPRHRLRKEIELMFFSFLWQVENSSVVLKDQKKGQRILAREFWWEALLLVTLNQARVFSSSLLFLLSKSNGASGKLYHSLSQLRISQGSVLLFYIGLSLTHLKILILLFLFCSELFLPCVLLCSWLLLSSPEKAAFLCCHVDIVCEVL